MHERKLKAIERKIEKNRIVRPGNGHRGDCREKLNGAKNSVYTVRRVDGKKG